MNDDFDLIHPLQDLWELDGDTLILFPDLYKMGMSFMRKIKDLNLCDNPTRFMIITEPNDIKAYEAIDRLQPIKHSPNACGLCRSVGGSNYKPLWQK